MPEYSASSALRDAFDRAHVQRGQALRDGWGWLTSRSFSRARLLSLSR